MQLAPVSEDTELDGVDAVDAGKTVTLAREGIATKSSAASAIGLGARAA